MTSHVYEQIQKHLRRDAVHEAGILEAKTTMQLGVPLKCAFLPLKWAQKDVESCTEKGVLPVVHVLYIQCAAFAIK